MLVVSPVTSLMKDQVESFGSEVSKGIKYNEGAGPSRFKLMLALALRGRSSYFTPVKCKTKKGMPNKREADSINGASKTFYGPWVSSKRLVHLLSRYE